MVNGRAFDLGKDQVRGRPVSGESRVNVIGVVRAIELIDHEFLIGLLEYDDVSVSVDMCGKLTSGGETGNSICGITVPQSIADAVVDSSIGRQRKADSRGLFEIRFDESQNGLLVSNARKMRV